MERNKPLVTVIIPAWNAEKYIEASVGSVLAQSHENLRLLVIDDGSTDHTAALLEQMARQDGRLLYYTVPNGGPALARNRALDRLPPETDYVMFMDADDLLLPDALEYALVGAARGAELVVFGFSIQSVDGSLRDYTEREEALPREKLGESLPRLYKANLLNQVWGKLYDARLLRGDAPRFPDYRWGEDRLFLFEVLHRVQQVQVLPGCKYRYLMHQGESLITRYYDKKFAVSCEIDRQVQALCRELGVSDDRDFRYMFAKSIFSCLTNLYAASCPLTAEERREAVRAIVNDPQVQQRLQGCSGGLSVQLLSRIVRSKQVGLNLLSFRAVTEISRRMPELVMRIKHRK